MILQFNSTHTSTHTSTHFSGKIEMKIHLIDKISNDKFRILFSSIFGEKIGSDISEEEERDKFTYQTRIDKRCS